MGEKYYEIEPIGHGHFGSAYDVGFNKILKLTRDEKEYDNAQILQNKDTEHLVKIFKSDVIDLGEGGKGIYWAILMEKLIKPSKNVIDIVDTLTFNDFPGKYEHWYEKSLYNIEQFPEKELNSWLLDTFENENTVNNARHILKQMIEIKKEAKEMGMSTVDLHGGNVGFKHDKLVLFDLG